MPTIYDVLAPDGTILEVEGSDNATDEQIEDYASQQFNATAEAPKLTMKQFQDEVIQRIRAGQTAEQIEEFANTVRDPNDPTGLVRRSVGPELQGAIEYFQKNPNVPIQVIDVTEGDKFGAALRGAADIATFNLADEAQALIQSGLTNEDYDTVVNRLRARRAIDAQVNPSERLAGQALGTIASAAAIPAKLFQGASTLGTISRGVLGGGTMGALSAFGAGQGADESLSAMPTGFIEGGAFGGAIPGAVAVARPVIEGVRRLASPQFGAQQVLRESGLSAEKLRQRMAQYSQEEIERMGLAELLTPSEAARFTVPLRSSIEATTALGERAEELSQRLGPDIISRIQRGTPEVQPSAGGAMRPSFDGIGAEERARLAAKSRGLTVPRSSRDLVGQGRELSDPRVVIEGGELFGERVAAGAPGARPFERVNVEIPKGVIGRVETPGSLRQKAKKFGAIAWGKFGDIPMQMDAGDRAYVEEAILPFAVSSLPKATRERLLTAFETNTMTIGDMDLIRRTLGNQANKGGAGKIGAGDYAALRDDVLAIMAETVPQTKQAVATYGALMQAAKGAEIGVEAAKPGADLIKVVDSLAEVGKRARPGIAPGARASVISQGMGNPRQAYRLASELEANPGFNKRFEAAVGASEAQDLADFAIRQKRGIDSLMAMARIPEEKIETTLGKVDGIIDVVAASTLNVGGAFKANAVMEIIRRAKTDQRTADRLANMLLNPKQRDIALKAIANLPRQDKMAKLGRLGQDIIYNSFLRTAAEIGKDNTRLPEGYIRTEEEGQL
jgi:hypothetical protein